MTRQFSSYKTLYLSFFSRELYRDVHRNWKGLGFRYLLLLSTITSLLMISGIYSVVSGFKPNELADKITQQLFEDPSLTFEQSLNRVLDIASQIPAIKLDHHQIKISEEQPYHITDPITGRVLAIMDTTGPIQSLEGTDTLLILNRNRIVTKTPDGEKIYYLSDEKGEEFDEQSVSNLLAILAQIPHITITDGAASINQPSPYFIYNADDEPIAILDTEGTYSSLDDSKANVLLTKTALFIRNPLDEKVKRIELSEINSDLVFTLLEETMSRARSMLLWAMPLLIWPIALLSSWLAAMMMAFLFGLTGLGLVSLLRTSNNRYIKPIRGTYTLDDLVKLSSVALTPTILLNILAPHVLSFQGLVYFLLGLGYLYFAVRANE